MLGWSCSCLSTDFSFHVKENQEISCTKGGTESGWPLIRFYWQIMLHIYLFLEPLLTVNAVQVLGLCLFVHLKEYCN